MLFKRGEGEIWRGSKQTNQWSQYRTVLASTARIFCTDTLTDTETRLFHTAFCTGTYQVVSTKSEKKSDTDRKKNTAQ